MKKELDKASTIGDIFSVVRRVVLDYFGQEQAGLLVGLSDLGDSQESIVGAFYSPESNTLVINKRPLYLIEGDKHNAYLFNILLKEYLHSLGYEDDTEVQMLVKDITKKYLRNVPTEFQGIISGGILPEAETLDIEYVGGIDRENTNYIL